MNKKCPWRERLTCVHIWYRKITVWCWGVITTSCKCVHHTIIAHPCNHLETCLLALSFTREFHKIWPNLSPFTEYWPFQIPKYERRNFKSCLKLLPKKKHRVYMLFLKNMIGETMPSYSIGKFSSYSIGKFFISFSTGIGMFSSFMT